MSDSAHLAEILRAIRDRYVSAARRRTVDVLRDVQQFYQTESDRCREEVSKLQKALVDFELRYPGVNPDFPDPNRTEQTTLMVERLGLEKKLDELKSRSERLVERIAKASEKPGQKVESTDEAPKMQPNPRYAELGQEIARLQREIAEKKTLRGMTEQHPAIQQLRATMAMRQEDLANTPGEIPATASSPAPPTESGISLPERLRRQLSDNEAEVTAHKTRLATINEQIADIERARAMAVENRQDYLKVRQQADSLDTELKTWQANIDAIQHIFTVEDRNRTIHFTTVKDVLAAAKPVSPLAAFVVAICLAIGAAAGVLCVLMAELVDRSYRTVKQLRTSLGIPVIESINEIVTAAVRRQRLIRHFVVMPAAALLCAGAMTVAAAMAYLSIESPAAYARMKSAPVRAVQAIQEPG